MLFSEDDQRKPAKGWLHPDELQVAEPFVSLFPIDPRERESIKQSIIEDGYNDSPPLIGWKEKGVLIDGHTRRDVCGELRQQVLVEWRSYPTLLAALKDALKQQTNRRNLSRDGAAMLRAVKIVDDEYKKQRGGTGANQYTGKSADRSRDLSATHKESHEPAKQAFCENGSAPIVASIVGCGTATVNRVRAVLEDPEETEAVLTNKKSIKKAASDARAKKNKKPPTKSAEEIIAASIEANGIQPDAFEACNHDSGLPFHEQGRINDEAIYKWIDTERNTLRTKLKEIVGTPSMAHISPLHYHVYMLLEVAPPSTWLPCRKCENRLHDRVTCKRCSAFGYEIPNIRGTNG